MMWLVGAGLVYFIVGLIVFAVTYDGDEWQWSAVMAALWPIGFAVGAMAFVSGAIANIKRQPHENPEEARKL